jgi:putative NADH-flavin reductase
MKLSILGATGMIGHALVEKALARGFTVTAFGRNVEDLIDKDNRNDNLHAVKGYVFDESDVLKAVKGADAVISAIGGSSEVTDKSRSLGMKNIIKQMDKAGVKRILALGNVGVLNADADHYVLDSPDYPQELRNVGQEHLLAYLFLEASSLDWTFVCPPAILAEDGNRQYITSADFLPQPDKQEIAVGDLADYILNEISENQYVHHRVGISRK